MKNVISAFIVLLLLFTLACNETSNVDVDDNGIKKYIFYTEATDEGGNIYMIDLENNQDSLLIISAVLFSPPNNNKIVYTSIDTTNQKCAITTSDINGQNKNELVSGEGIFLTCLSPDASKILYFVRDDLVEIHVMNFDGTNDLVLVKYEQITDDYFPVAKFSTDSKKVAFITQGEDEDTLYTINCNGSNLSIAGIADGLRLGIDWSPDGTKIAGIVIEDENQINIRSFDVDGTGSDLLTTDGIYKVKPAFSPDGSLIAYFQDVCDIHVINSDGSGHRKLTDNKGDDNDIKFIYPTWSPDGKYIVYPSTQNPEGGDIYFGDELRTVDVKTGDIKTYATGKQIFNGYMYFTK